MAKRRIINTKFWSDNYISNLDPSEKLLFLYFLTNPYTNISGAYEISIKQIALDTGFDKEMVEKIIKRFEKDEKIHYIHGYIVIKNFIKHQEKNPKVIIGVENEAKNLPNDIKNIVYRSLSYLNSNFNPNPNPNSNPVGENDKQSSKRFEKPTIEEIQLYCIERKNAVHPQVFIDHYESNGWRVGRNPMKNWKAAVRTWERNEFSSKESKIYKNKDPANVIEKLTAKTI